MYIYSMHQKKKRLHNIHGIHELHADYWYWLILFSDPNTHAGYGVHNLLSGARVINSMTLPQDCLIGFYYLSVQYNIAMQQSSN